MGEKKGWTVLTLRGDQRGPIQVVTASAIGPCTSRALGQLWPSTPHPTHRLA